MLLRDDGQFDDLLFAGGEGHMGLDDVGAGGQRHAGPGDGFVVEVPFDLGDRLGIAKHQPELESAARGVDSVAGDIDEVNRLSREMLAEE